MEKVVHCACSFRAMMMMAPVENEVKQIKLKPVPSPLEPSSNTLVTIDVIVKSCSSIGSSRHRQSCHFRNCEDHNLIMHPSSSYPKGEIGVQAVRTKLIQDACEGSQPNQANRSMNKQFDSIISYTWLMGITYHIKDPDDHGNPLCSRSSAKCPWDKTPPPPPERFALAASSTGVSLSRAASPIPNKLGKRIEGPKITRTCQVAGCHCSKVKHIMTTFGSFTDKKNRWVNKIKDW